MRIGYFITLYPYPESFYDPAFCSRYPVGGAEKWAYHLAREMVKLGHEVLVFTASADSKTHVEEEDGVKVFRYGTNLKIEKARFSYELLFKPLRENVDIAHLHFALPPGHLAGLFYSRMKKKPLVVTYHGDAKPDYGNWIRRIGLKMQDSFIVPLILSSANCITTYSANYIDVSHFLPKYKEKIIAIPTGADNTQAEKLTAKEDLRRILSINTEARVILFVGALIDYKSPDLLIRAMPKILKNNPDAELVLVGDGHLRGELEKLAGELNITNSVKFAGMVPYGNTHMYYGAADVFVLPSTGRTEVFPLVLPEAAAAGLPIVVSSLDTFRAFIKDGYNGLVAQIGDAASLADKINILLSDPLLRKEIGANARESVKDYSWANVAQKVADIYEAVLKPRGS